MVGETLKSTQAEVDNDRTDYNFNSVHNLAFLADDSFIPVLQIMKVFS